MTFAFFFGSSLLEMLGSLKIDVNVIEGQYRHSDTFTPDRYTDVHRLVNIDGAPRAIVSA